MWTLEITSSQFSRRNWNLRTLPLHLLKVSYLDSNIKTGDINTLFCISIYDKRDDFALIVNFPHMGSNIPANPAYGILDISTGEIC